AEMAHVPALPDRGGDVHAAAGELSDEVEAAGVREVPRAAELRPSRESLAVPPSPHRIPDRQVNETDHGPPARAAADALRRHEQGEPTAVAHRRRDDAT